MAEGIDAGPVIAQVPVSVFDDDDEVSLHHRIQVEERKIYPQVTRWFAEDSIQVDNRKAVITPPKKR